MFRQPPLTGHLTAREGLNGSWKWVCGKKSLRGGFPSNWSRTTTRGAWREVVQSINLKKKKGEARAQGQVSILNRLWALISRIWLLEELMLEGMRGRMWNKNLLPKLLKFWYEREVFKSEGLHKDKPPDFHGSKVEKDPQGFIDEVYKILIIMVLPLEMRETKVLEFINLRQGSMSVREYARKFTQLSKYAPTMVVDSRARMSKFVSGVSKMVVKEWGTAMLIHDMDISRLMVHAQQIEEEKHKEKSREAKKRSNRFVKNPSWSMGSPRWAVKLTTTHYGAREKKAEHVPRRGSLLATGQGPWVSKEHAKLHTDHEIVCEGFLSSLEFRVNFKRLYLLAQNELGVP
ncbi:hypothetical protein MTR67_047954 [Solanum verrucosum]|uniref:Retrotransposon gag domain-containing protein n=1 Tax=Solanum verrucosum TaxID=315347 RepID=A0AAF0UZZ1_SOLVR|nr:hypothetical protein MTR67_047954 [Solanum verrucosum]